MPSDTYYSMYVILRNHVECTEYYRCHHKLSPMNNNHILDIQMMVNVSNQLILCGLSMMTPQLLENSQLAVMDERRG